jgi:cell division protein FtsN
MLLVVGVLSVLGVTFGSGVYLGRIWQARSVVVVAKVSDEPVRRGLPRGRSDQPSPQLTFYQELTAPLTAPPPPPKPAKSGAPPLVTLPAPAAPPVSAKPTHRPGEQADVLAAVVRTGTPTPLANGIRFTIQVASYRLRQPADALRETLAAAGHEARVVEAESNGAVYRVQVGEFATRDAARAAAARFGGSPYITTR